VARIVFLFIFFIHIVKSDNAQIPDSLLQKDSLLRTGSNFQADSLVKDSIALLKPVDTSWKKIAIQYSGNQLQKAFAQKNPFFAFDGELLILKNNIKQFHGKEALFYSIIVILVFFAFIKTAFSKYLTNLFRVAFRTTMKQRQIGEQLIQTPLPSLLLNLFFLITTSYYICFLLQHYQLATSYPFWLLFIYCLVGLACIYLVKFISLKVFGLLFNIPETTDDYIFTVFMINKIIGIFLLPFIVLLAFTDDSFYKVFLSLSFIGLAGLYGYRFVLSYGLVRSQVRFNPFHFLLYLISFEVIPLLLIYKLLLLWLK